MSEAPLPGRRLGPLAPDTHLNLAQNFMPKRKKIFILDTNVILHDSSCNLRMKARSVRLMAEDYTTDNVRDPAHMYSGCHYAEDLPAELIARLYDQDGELTGKEYAPATPLYPNEYLVLRNGKKSALATCIAGEMANDFTIKRVKQLPR